MPELPEVETLRQDLDDWVVGRTIQSVQVHWQKTIADPEPAAFGDQLAGCRVTGTDRRGKYLILNLDNGANLIIHLRMTGQLLRCATLPDERKHVHVILALDNNEMLLYRDVRKFGRMWLVDDVQQVVGDLGPEPLGDDFTQSAFAQRLAQHRGMIKPLLLNQRFIAGLGNIYTDEALFMASIHPERRACDLTETDAANLYDAIRAVLVQGIRHRGTTLNDFCDLEGETGENQNSLSVFQRTEEPCPRCGTQIQRAVVGGRGTFFCPKCQASDDKNTVLV